MGNTVIDEYDALTIVEDIRLNFNQDNVIHEVMIVVEGEDDKKALMKFFNLQVVDFFYTCNCLAVRDSMRIVTTDEQLKDCVIGIKDGDFDYLKGVKYDHIPNLFLTDTHDMETMMLTSRVCRCLCLEMMQNEYPNLLSEAMSSLKNLSYIRYYNDKMILDVGDPNAKGINFKGLVIGGVIPMCVPVGVEKWLDAIEILGNSGKPSFPNLDQIMTFIDDNPICEEQLPSFTNGHDLVFVIRDKLHSLSEKAKKYGEKDIEYLIRANFDKDEFMDTQLYEELNNWNNGRYDLWLA